MPQFVKVKMINSGYNGVYTVYRNVEDILEIHPMGDDEYNVLFKRHTRPDRTVVNCRRTREELHTLYTLDQIP